MRIFAGVDVVAIAVAVSSSQTDVISGSTMADFDRTEPNNRLLRPVAVRHDLSHLRVTPEGIAGLSVGLDIYGEMQQYIKESHDAIKAIPQLQENTDTIKVALVVVAGAMVALAAAMYFKR